MVFNFFKSSSSKPIKASFGAVLSNLFISSGFFLSSSSFFNKSLICCLKKLVISSFKSSSELLYNVDNLSNNPRSFLLETWSCILPATIPNNSSFCSLFIFLRSFLNFSSFKFATSPFLKLGLISLMVLFPLNIFPNNNEFICSDSREFKTSLLEHKFVKGLYLFFGSCNFFACCAKLLRSLRIIGLFSLIILFIKAVWVSFDLFLQQSSNISPKLS